MATHCQRCGCKLSSPSLRRGREQCAPCFERRGQFFGVAFTPLTPEQEAELDAFVDLRVYADTRTAVELGDRPVIETVACLGPETPRPPEGGPSNMPIYLDFHHFRFMGNTWSEE